jgi:hypothetical protein
MFSEARSCIACILPFEQYAFVHFWKIRGWLEHVRLGHGPTNRGAATYLDLLVGMMMDDGDNGNQIIKMETGIPQKAMLWRFAICLFCRTLCQWQGHADICSAMQNVKFLMGQVAVNASNGI